MVSAISEDFKRKSSWLHGNDNLANIMKTVLSDASMCMILYRLTRLLNSYLATKVLAFIIYKINLMFCGAVIGRGASFGKGFVILHSVGVVINTRVAGGENIYIESGVVIGETKRGCPVLGDNIFVGSGAKIIGDITIGNNVTIGANAVVVKSVPDNVVVGGVPAKVIRIKGYDEKLLIG
jgi:serine O-acetyltransferase